MNDLKKVVLIAYGAFHNINIYLVLVCALLELFKLIIEHSELPGDALYSSMQSPILAVLGVEIIFIPLTLLRRADHCIFPRDGNTERYYLKRLKKKGHNIHTRHWSLKPDTLEKTEAEQKRLHLLSNSPHPTLAYESKTLWGP